MLEPQLENLAFDHCLSPYERLDRSIAPPSREVFSKGHQLSTYGCGSTIVAICFVPPLHVTQRFASLCGLRGAVSLSGPGAKMNRNCRMVSTGGTRKSERAPAGEILLTRVSERDDDLQQPDGSSCKQSLYQ